MTLARGRLENPVQYLIKVFYLGTDFAGSQFQPNERTVEGVLINALTKCGYITSKEDNHFKRASRTDLGVHARINIFSFFSDKKMYPIEINSNLPSDVGIWAYAIAPEPVNPRFLPKSREYLYYFPIRLLPTPFNFELMHQALSFFKGTHDFKYLCKPEPERSTTRTIFEAECTQDQWFVKFRFVGDSFLWHQIRKMVQLLIDIGQESFSIWDLADVLRADPKYEGIQFDNANPNGLILWDMKLPEEIEHLFIIEEKSMERFFRQFSDRTFIQLTQATFQSEMLKEWGKGPLF